MKRILFLTLVAVLCVIPAWADDGLSPEPLEQAIREYRAIEESGGQIDPMNHETWKLYIQVLLFPKGLVNQVPLGFLCSLAPGRHPKRHFFTVVKINNLYNFFDKVPQVGDVIAVEGRITEYFKNFHLDDGTHVRSFKVVNFYPENAKLLPREPEKPPLETTTQVPTPGATIPPAGAASAPIPPVSKPSPILR